MHYKIQLQKFILAKIFFKPGVVEISQYFHITLFPNYLKPNSKDLCGSLTAFLGLPNSNYHLVGDLTNILDQCK